MVKFCIPGAYSLVSNNYNNYVVSLCVYVYFIFKIAGPLVVYPVDFLHD